MNKKFYFTILGIVLFIGGTFAANSLYNLEGINVPMNTISGNTFSANFNFNYLLDGVNADNSPLIIQLNFTSKDESYPVWKEDFKVKGEIDKCTWLILGNCVNHRSVEFNCSEEEIQEIVHPLDSQTVIAENGTFYCYNEKGDLELNERDEVRLYVTSNIALYPGEYNLTAKLFYLTDEKDPVIIFLNQSYFNQYFRDGSYVDFEVNITDGSGIQNYYSRIEDEKNISFAKEIVKENTYHFYQTLPIDITEGEHIVRVVAIDKFGNHAEKTATIKIDLTAPEIRLISPQDNLVYSEIIPIKINVTDEKAGVDYEEVYYRIREVKEEFGLCPESGEGFGDGTACYNSGWINAPFDFDLGLNYNEFDSGLIEGEYWLEVRAQDILENTGVLE